jgi:UDP-N-acetylmuramyl pentapeptide synthase
MIVATPLGRLEIITNLVGRHNVYNVLAAVAVGVLLNLPLEDIGAGIESVQFVPGRCVAECAATSLVCQVDSVLGKEPANALCSVVTS